MKKITIERKIHIPDNGYCILWKSTTEQLCPFLQFRKDAMNKKIVWKCTVLDLSLENNLNAHGIINRCEKEEDIKNNVFEINLK